MSPLGHIVERCGESCYLYYIHQNLKCQQIKSNFLNLENYAYLLAGIINAKQHILNTGKIFPD